MAKYGRGCSPSWPARVRWARERAEGGGAAGRAAGRRSEPAQLGIDRVQRVRAPGGVRPPREARPRLATGWRWLDDRTLEVTLRRGVKFHNGEAFDAEIVKLNWEENYRARQPHAVGTYMNFKHGSRVEIGDPFRVRFVFPEPDGGALVKLQSMHIGNRQFYRELGWGEKHW